MRRDPRVLLLLVAALPLVAGCGLFGGADDEQEGVRSIKPGQCFLVPKEVKAQVADLGSVPCNEPHDRESFAVLPYEPPDAETDGEVFPGDDALITFADGRCAEAFGNYSGVPYLDSDLYFTYLLPSPRSWQVGDREVVCFAFDPGRPLSGSLRQEAPSEPAGSDPS